MEAVPIVIDHPKSHPHTLTFFPRQTSLACNICGLTNNTYPTYICTECVFVIHKNCIGFPHVIRVSRHNNRISFTSFLPSGKLSCGVCHQPVDNNFGAYSCRICDAYVVHSRCALHDDVWDGKELEGVPEEDDIIDDGEPFERIADGIIHHPSHSHHIRLENSEVYDEKKFCRGCGLPIYQGKYYSCVECDFILHESCAHAPRMKRHPLYAHPLTLNFAIEGYNNGKNIFVCDVCKAPGSGFAYEYRIKDDRPFRLDLRCALVAEPFDYQGHKHPLFLTLDREEQARCQICKYNCYSSKLNCMECEYSICLSCATLPYKARYKHDSHFLTISDRKEEGDQPDWCEVCDRRQNINTRRRRTKEFQLFYKCDECCVAIHVTCLLGKEMYILVKICSIEGFRFFSTILSPDHFAVDAYAVVHSQYITET